MLTISAITALHLAYVGFAGGIEIA